MLGSDVMPAVDTHILSEVHACMVHITSALRPSSKGSTAHIPRVLALLIS